ncbi:hypothetical protein ACKWTF_004563 [Chironomus riparius]
MLDILIISIFQLYALVRYSILNAKSSGMKIATNSYYMIMNILLICLIAHAGHCTTSHAESILTIIAKNVSKLPSQSAIEYYNLLRQSSIEKLEIAKCIFWN